MVAAIGNEGGSQATLLGEGSGSQLSRASDAPTQIPEHESDATSECVPLRYVKWVNWSKRF